MSLKKVSAIFSSERQRKRFRPIDIDTPGGFARVAEVHYAENNANKNAAFKVLRHDVPNKAIGRSHFLKELKLLNQIGQLRNKPNQTLPAFLNVIPQIYDSGFVPSSLPEYLDNYRKPDPDHEVYQTGLSVEAFEKQLDKLDPNEWSPFIVIELASYDASLFRQIQRQPIDGMDGLFRLPTAEIVYVAIKLLDAVKWLHETMEIMYFDWKPEHIHWDYFTRELKLIDWNVNAQIDSPPSKEQNIRDDIRLFCGAFLYCGLTLLDPDFGHPIGPRPEIDIINLVPETRRRYLTDDPQFHYAENFLDDEIMDIVRKGLDPARGYADPLQLQNDLKVYLYDLYKITPQDLENGKENKYLDAIQELRTAQRHLKRAYQLITEATETLGTNDEFKRLAEIIRNVQKRLP